MSNRRTFIKGAALAAGAGAVLTLPDLSFGKTTNPAAIKLEFYNEGVVPFGPDIPNFILAPGPPPPDLLAVMPLLQQGILAIKVSTGMKDNVLYTKVHGVPGPNYNPMIVPLPPMGYIPISEFNVAVESVTLGNNTANPLYNFSVTGRVVSTPVPSPFGELIGRAASFSADFDVAGPNTQFYFMGGFVAGSHSTWVPFAVGNLSVNTKPTSL